MDTCKINIKIAKKQFISAFSYLTNCGYRRFFLSSECANSMRHLLVCLPTIIRLTLCLSAANPNYRMIVDPSSNMVVSSDQLAVDKFQKSTRWWYLVYISHFGGKRESLPHNLLVDEELQLLLCQVVLVLVKVEELLWNRVGGRLVIWVVVRLKVWVLERILDCDTLDRVERE